MNKVSTAVTGTFALVLATCAWAEPVLDEGRQEILDAGPAAEELDAGDPRELQDAQPLEDILDAGAPDTNTGTEPGREVRDAGERDEVE